MFQHNLWHRALKLNKGIYKTTEHLSDAEILKKQLREQTNEILSTISVFCSRPTSTPSSPNLHSVIASPAAEAASGSVAGDEVIPSAPQNSPSSMIHNSRFMIHDFYVPESEICLMLLLDKITVLKTFLFLAKEHNFFNEEKHQILTAACVHLSESVQSELHGADIFSHPIFSVSPEVVPPPGFGGPTSKHSSSAPANPIGHTAQIPDNLSDILDNVSDIIHESAENLSDISASPDSSPLNAKRYTLNASPDSSPLNASPESSPLNANRYTLNASPNLSDTPDKKAENYIFKSRKSRQNKSFKSYLPKFLNPKRYTLNAPPESSPLNANRYPPERLASFSRAGSLNASIAVEESSQNDVFAAYSIFFPDSSVSPEIQDSIRQLADKIQDSTPAPLNPNRYTLNANRFPLTPRQQKLHDFLLQNAKAKIGDLTALFPEKISEKTIRRDLQILIDKSLVSQSGSRRWTYYSVS